MRDELKLTEAALEKEGISFKNHRATGRTTRLADNCVQEFFDNGFCFTKDHWGTKDSDRRLMEIVLRRLYLEHNITSNMVDIDKSHFKISKI